MVHLNSNPRRLVHGRFRKPSAFQSVLFSACVLSTLSAHAQSAVQAGRSDPLDPKATVPALNYVSSFSQYRLLGDEKSVSWRDANDTVTRIGGWRVYAREAQQPDPTPSAPGQRVAPAATTDNKATTPAGHGGHKMP